MARPSKSFASPHLKWLAACPFSFIRPAHFLSFFHPFTTCRASFSLFLRVIFVYASISFVPLQSSSPTIQPLLDLSICFSNPFFLPSFPASQSQPTTGPNPAHQALARTNPVTERRRPGLTLLLCVPRVVPPYFSPSQLIRMPLRPTP